MPNNVIQKVYNGWNEYLVGGWTTEWAEVVYLTQAEYDALPASKLTDGKIYKIKTSGVAPTPGGGTVIERGDMLLSKISYASEIDNLFVYHAGNYMELIFYYPNWIEKFRRNWSNSVRRTQPLMKTNYLFDFRYDEVVNTSDVDWSVQKYDINWTLVDSLDLWRTYRPSRDMWPYWFFDNYFIFHWKKISYDLEILWDATQEEINAIPSWLYYKGLYYTQDNNDYVASDVNGTEVKRYSNVGTINGIYDDKLYRNVGDVAYTIATI